MTTEIIMNIMQAAAFYNNMVHQKSMPQIVQYNDMTSWLKILDTTLTNINSSINSLIALNHLSGWDCVAYRDPDTNLYTSIEFSCLICRTTNLMPIAELIQSKLRNHLEDIEITEDYILIINFKHEYETPNITTLQQSFEDLNDMFVPIKDYRPLPIF